MMPPLKLLVCACGLALSSTAVQARVLDPWVGTWGVAAQATTTASSPAGKTLRQIVHTSVGGSAVRVTVSNAFGDGPLIISNAHVARSLGGSAVDTATDRPITFSGLSSVTLAPGEAVTSDGVDFVVPQTGDLTVSFYVPQAPASVTGHAFSQQDRYEASGNVSGTPTLNATTTWDYAFLTGVDVQSDTTRGAVVTIGASLPDGYGSTYGANHRWPNRLAGRIAAAGLDVGVINEGISGNALLTDGMGDSAIKRFDRDVLGQSGARGVIFSDEPLNDIAGGNPQATAPNVITTVQGLIDRAHEKGLRFACSTLTPWEGSTNWTPARETIRADINAWIRSSASTCDAVIDLDKATHDPSRPTAFLPALDSGDHIHTNDAGYAAIAAAVDLSLFTPLSLPALSPSTACGTFKAGDGLTVGQGVNSCDGRFMLVFQGDGNIVLYQNPGIPLWATGTVNRDAAQFQLTASGDFVLYGKLGEVLWRSGNAGQHSAEAFLQNDGNLVIYGPGKAVWASNTQR